MTFNRTTLIVGNWKMHLNVHQSSLLVHRLSERIKVHRDLEVILAPSMLAKPQDVEKSVAYMRMQIHELYGERAAERMTILYGGSVNEHDVQGYLEVPGVDGALVGAASLNYHQFTAIVDAAYQRRLQVTQE
jgi:triosephosphate isomerase